jgi:uncharacterized protein YegP (UPF0339 family)
LAGAGFDTVLGQGLNVLITLSGILQPLPLLKSGIGGYDLLSRDDRAFAYDYDGSGKLDHLVLYRPGNGSFYVLRNNAGQFEPAFLSHNGIGGYDVLSLDDQAFAYDYDGSGKLDHLVLYRPGNGSFYILKNNAGQFEPVFLSHNGIGGYDVLSLDDRAFAYDYDGSGKLDHLVLYRPGNGSFYVLRNNAGQFEPAFLSHNGIGGYDVLSRDDQAFAYDYDGSGKLDHLVLYRPGNGTIWILKNNSGQFTPIYQTGVGHPV